VIYVEGGGGRNPALRSACRRAFSTLFQRAGIRHRPAIVPCGSRKAAYDDFCHALARGDVDPWLLVDAESPVGKATTAWAHVAGRDEDKWQRPFGATDAHLHFMAVTMETWLVADPDALQAVFKRDFDPSELPPIDASLELRPKDRIYQDLKQATARTKSGPYGKGAHSFKVLGHVDPARLDALPWARRFLDALRNP